MVFRRDGRQNKEIDAQIGKNHAPRMLVFFTETFWSFVLYEYWSSP